MNKIYIIILLFFSLWISQTFSFSWLLYNWWYSAGVWQVDFYSQINPSLDNSVFLFSDQFDYNWMIWNMWQWAYTYNPKITNVIQQDWISEIYYIDYTNLLSEINLSLYEFKLMFIIFLFVFLMLFFFQFYILTKL